MPGDGIGAAGWTSGELVAHGGSEPVTKLLVDHGAVRLVALTSHSADVGVGLAL
ncbi:MAG: hypothetical protein ABWY45_08310 [Mycobacterium sp.]